MGAAVGLVGITAAVIWRARRAPWLATGWFWYLGMLVPVIGLVQVGAQSMADRYTYVPLVGLFIMLCWSVPCSGIRRPILKTVTSVAAAAVLMVCVVLSMVQVRYWKNTATLFDHALKVTRDNWLAHCNLGMALAQAGKIREAIGQYQQALRIEPACADAHYNLGVFLSQAGRVEEAIWHYEQVVRLKPDDADAHNNLGLALQQVGKIEDAISHYEQALRIKPDDVEVHCNLGMALTQAGRIEEAIGHYEQALRLKPDFAEAQETLARLRSGR
jgi:protein O-mannosyl-transferase